MPLSKTETLICHITLPTLDPYRRVFYKQSTAIWSAEELVSLHPRIPMPHPTMLEYSEASVGFPCHDWAELAKDIIRLFN